MRGLKYFKNYFRSVVCDESKVWNRV